MMIRPLGQSGYLLESGQTRLLLDPYLSDAVERIAGRPRLLPRPLEPAAVTADAVICTHDHADHLDSDAIRLMPRGLRFVSTPGGCDRLRALGRTDFVALATGDSLTIGDFELTAAFARHTVETFGLIARAEGLTLYFSSDTLFDERLLEVAAYRPDAVFICINGRLGNMNTEEALAVCKRLGAGINVPNHYDMFASNSAEPAKFSDRIAGGRTLEFNREYILEAGGHLHEK